MTDRELLELLLKKLTTMETDLTGVKDTVETIREQTAGLTEFKTEMLKITGRHELDIQLLKKLASQ